MNIDEKSTTVTKVDEPSPPASTAGAAEEPRKSILKKTKFASETNLEPSSNLRAQFQRRESVNPLAISTTNVSFHIPSNDDANHHIREEFGADSWQSKTAHFLHSKKVQLTLVALLLLDVVILFTELFLAAEYPPCYIIEENAISCCSASAEDEHRRWLAGSEDHHDAFCQSPYVDHLSIPASCDEHKHEAVHKIEEVLFVFTIAILLTFLVELIVLMAAITPGVFFRQFFYTLDFFVVSVSLALELTFHFLDQEVLATASGLLVVGRLWRFLRIGHGLVEATHEFSHVQQAGLLAYAAKCEALLIEQKIQLPDGGPMFEGDDEHHH